MRVPSLQFMVLLSTRDAQSPYIWGEVCLRTHTIETIVCIIVNWEHWCKMKLCRGLWLFLWDSFLHATKHWQRAKLYFPFIPPLQLPCQWKAYKCKMHSKIKQCRRIHILCHNFQLLCLHNTANNLPQINPCLESPSLTQAQQLWSYHPL